MTPEEKIIFRKGFKVAINFLYHHHLDEKGQPDPVAQEKFREFLLANTDTSREKEIIEEAINLRTTMEGGGGCGSGFCLDADGTCVRCRFKFAFNGTFHS